MADAGSIAALDAPDDLKKALRSNFNLLNSGGPLASLRDNLLAGVIQGLCPLCGRGSAATLDHYLPKSRYPEFSVFPMNLVPACDDCNRSKGSRWGVTPDAQTLHSYMHQLPDEEVLRATVDVGLTVVIDFHIQKTPSLSQELFRRAKYHFRVLKLRKHFLREANREMADRRGALLEVFGPDESRDSVQEYLITESQSVRGVRGLNNWKTALLLALSRSEPFWTGGFRLL